MSKYFKNYYKFVIPKNPDSINKVMDFGKKNGDVHNLKRKWEKLAMLYIKEYQENDKLPEKFKGRIGVHFKLVFETNRERDGDNYTLMCKGILDAFTKMGMIEDDNHNFVDDDGRRFEINPDAPSVIVYITEKIREENIVSIKY